MEPRDKIACCNICMLSEGMKVCKECPFNPSRVLPRPTEAQLKDIVHKELYQKSK